MPGAILVWPISGWRSFLRPKQFARAIGLDQKHRASHVNMGNALINTLQPGDALKYLERGVDLEATQPIRFGIYRWLISPAIISAVGIITSSFCNREF